MTTTYVLFFVIILLLIMLSLNYKNKKKAQRRVEDLELKIEDIALAIGGIPLQTSGGYRSINEIIDDIWTYVKRSKILSPTTEEEMVESNGPH